MSSLPLARDFIEGDPGAPPTLVNQLSIFRVAQVEQPLEFCSLTASPQLSCKGLLEATDETVALARFNVLQELAVCHHPHTVLCCVSIWLPGSPSKVIVNVSGYQTFENTLLALVSEGSPEG